jgi:uncharacterized protein (TIGR02598 family)
MKLNTRKASAFSLAEVTLALGIAAFCLILVLGLIPAGLTSNQNAKSQTVASSIAASVILDLQSTTLAVPRGSTDQKSPAYLITVPKAGGTQPGTTCHFLFFKADGTATGTLDKPPTNDSIYRVSVAVYPPANVGGKQQKSATVARILVTWPAQSDITTAWPSKFADFYEITTTLDRN